MEIDQFSVEESDQYWELYFGRRGVVDGDVGSALHGMKILHIQKEREVYFPDEQFTAMILERLNGFPKAIEFLYALSKKAEDPGSHSNADTVELISDFLRAVPHKGTLFKQEEPKPREFRVDFEVVRKGHVYVTATTKEEAEKAAFETPAQEDLYEYLGREEAQHGDEAADMRVTRIEEAE